MAYLGWSMPQHGVCFLRNGLIDHLQGNIFFHYVKDDDFVRDKYYTCTVHNEILDEYKFGEMFQVKVREKSSCFDLID